MTPQTQLTLSKVFENKEIRAIEYHGEVWIPIVDIAEAWGLDRSNVTKIINRNPEVFAGLSTVVDVMSPNTLPSDIIGNSLKCVNEQGVYVLALKVSAGRIKDKEVKKTIIRFQKWVPELIQQFRKGELISTAQLQKPVDILNHELDIADSIIKRTGMEKSQAHAYAVILAGDKSGMDLQCYATAIKAQSTQKQLSETIQPLDQGEFDKHFSIQRLASHFGKTKDVIHNTLEKLTIITRSPSGVWYLTKHGESFGKTFKVIIGYPYQNKEVTWIRYNPACVDLLKKYFDVEVPK